MPKVIQAITSQPYEGTVGSPAPLGGPTSAQENAGLWDYGSLECPHGRRCI